MKLMSSKQSRGYTVVELMITIVIVSVFAVGCGSFVVKLLTFQENEREEAYVREKLVDICGAYADALSIGSSFSMRPDSHSGQEIVVKYRQETGGVSLETGVVTRAAYLVSSLNPTNNMVELGVYGVENENLSRRFSRTANGGALLLPVVSDIVSFRLTPIGGTIVSEEDVHFVGFQAADAALGYLEVMAKYKAKGVFGVEESKTVTAGRVVRLWNRQ